jgi:hypothetical protein
LYDEIQLCVIWSYEEVIGPMIQESGVRQGSNLAPYLFNTLIVDIIDYISTQNAQKHTHTSNTSLNDTWITVLQQSGNQITTKTDQKDGEILDCMKLKMQP